MNRAVMSRDGESGPVGGRLTRFSVRRYAERKPPEQCGVEGRPDRMSKTGNDRFLTAAVSVFSVTCRGEGKRKEKRSFDDIIIITRQYMNVCSRFWRRNFQRVPKSHRYILSRSRFFDSLITYGAKLKNDRNKRNSAYLKIRKTSERPK